MIDEKKQRTRLYFFLFSASFAAMLVFAHIGPEAPGAIAGFSLSFLGAALFLLLWIIGLIRSLVKKRTSTRRRPEEVLPPDPYNTAGKRYRPAVHLSNEEEIEKEIRELNDFYESPDLAPAEINGFARSYHYRDVNLRVPWQLRGEYDNEINSVRKLGVKRGDLLQISFDPHNISDEYDPDNVVISWRGVKLGDMQKTRLRRMVKDWLQIGLPVFCAMSKLSDDRNFYIELGFYGKP